MCRQEQQWFHVKCTHKKSHKEMFFFFFEVSSVFLNYSKWHGKGLCKCIAPRISGEPMLCLLTSTYTAKRMGLLWRGLCPRFRLSGQPCEVGVLSLTAVNWGNLFHSMQPVGCAPGIPDQVCLHPRPVTDGLPLGVHSAVQGHVNTLSQFRVGEVRC